MTSLEAISPVDGRYHSKTESLSPYFSEHGLIHYRVKVEVEYLDYLIELGVGRLKNVNNEDRLKLKSLADSFTLEDSRSIKSTERITNHDVKAVEYFIKEKMNHDSFKPFLEFVHFGLTSQDINNSAIPWSIKDALNQVIIPKLDLLLTTFNELSNDLKGIPMLARTHGQPASPTSLSKEIMVFTDRLNKQITQLKNHHLEVKFGGATGNLNAHFVSFPNYDWPELFNQMTEDRFGLRRSQRTTQIAHYDDIADLCHIFQRINTILIDFSRDIWTYIMLEYFKQKVVKGEVGSSAMPHKVNPIDFENAEGNLGIANAIFDHLASKLPISRLQRDLTDSTVLRNIGVPFAHVLIAITSLLKGIGKLEVNKKAIQNDLDQNWAVVAEAIQNILRREGYLNPYEALKALTRGKQGITQESLHAFINELNVDDNIKVELKAITPFNYIGNAE